MAVAHVDGSSRAHTWEGQQRGPGQCAAVFTGKLGDLNSPVFIEKYDEVSSNEAEYLGLILALRQAGRHGARTLHVYTDSQVLARQIHGRYKVRSENLHRLYAQAMELIKQFDLVVVQHIPRERNQIADKHSR